MHGGGNGTDHPAVPVTATDFAPDAFGFRAVPKLFPCGSFIEISHNFFILGAVAGHYIPVRVNEKGVKSHVTGKETFLSINVVDQPVVKISPEPFFRAF